MNQTEFIAEKKIWSTVMVGKTRLRIMHWTGNVQWREELFPYRLNPNCFHPLSLIATHNHTSSFTIYLILYLELFYKNQLNHLTNKWLTFLTNSELDHDFFLPRIYFNSYWDLFDFNQFFRGDTWVQSIKQRKGKKQITMPSSSQVCYLGLIKRKWIINLW